MKYVIFLKDCEMHPGKKIYCPVFFPTHVTHADMHLIGDRRAHHFYRGEMVSAGFFFVKAGGVIGVEDRISESTRLGPGEHDAKILQLAFDGARYSKFHEENFK